MRTLIDLFNRSKLGKRFNRMSLRGQILIPTVLIVVVTGLALSVTSGLRIKSIIHRELELKGRALCKALADNAEENIRKGDFTVLQSHIEEYRKTEGVAYIYIVDSGNQAVGHTFSPSFPEGFQDLNMVPSGTSQLQVKTIENKGLYAMDIASPVLAGVLGTAHIGMDLNLERSQVRANYWISLFAVLLVLIPGLGALSYFILSRVKVLRAAIAKLQDIAWGRGDLTQRIEVDSQDEIGQMAEAFNTFADKMQGMVQSIGMNIQSLLAASAQLTQTAEGMGRSIQDTSFKAAVVSEGAGQVSQNLQSVSSATQGMAVSIREIAQSAGQAAQVANSAVSIAKGTETSVARLGKSGEEIDEVTKAITDIASQTTFLALNANLEAVRAGAAGKGFVLVAAQVRELATQTTRFAGEITEKIRAIQDDTRSSMTAIAQIRQVIDRINEISGSIASEVAEQSISTSEMEKSITQATAASTEIADNISNVARTAENTSRGAGEVQKAAAGLSQVATDLRKLVGQFKY
jgi:methyl-accepting chemotaxis protein